MGGGAGVIDSGFHFLDTVQYFFGEPEQVYAELRAVGEGGAILRGPDILTERESSAVITLTFNEPVDPLTIFFDDSGMVGILDLVSKNGTFVNGAEVESKILKKGDLITVGGTKIRFES